MSKRLTNYNKISRRDLLKLSALLAGALAYLKYGPAACVPMPASNESSPKKDDLPSFGPLLAFTSLITEMSITTPTRGLPLESVITDPVQLDYFLEPIARNWRRESRIVQIQRKITEGKVIGWSGCPDSRETIPGEIPADFLPDVTPNVVPGNGTANYALDIDPATGKLNNLKSHIDGSILPDDWSRPIGAVVSEVRQVGTQPSLFPAGVNESVFITHEAIELCGTGCGYLGGVDAMIKDPTLGIEALKAHGVPDETIGYIQNWLANNRHRFADPSIIKPDEWAQIGAEIQASINYQKYGQSHKVLFAVRADGSESVRKLGWVDHLGNVVYDNFDEVPILSGAIDYVNRPHPLIESVVKGQQPGMNIVSASKRITPAQAFGEYNQNEAFIVNLDNRPPTKEALDELIAGFDYSPGALKQRGNIIHLMADTPEEMTMLRQAFMQTSIADDFFKNGGKITELLINENGLINRNVVVRSLENPLAIVTLTENEAKLMKYGVKKPFASIRIPKTINGASKTVIIETIDKKVYQIEVPAGATKITAEMLEDALIPTAKAVILEKSLLKIFGGIGLVAGIAWTISDLSKYYTDINGLGETLQLKATDDFDPRNFGGELLQALINMGLELTPAVKSFKADYSADDLADLMVTRIQDNFIRLQSGEDPTLVDDGFFLKLDSPIADLAPLGFSDRYFDFGTSIRVSHNGWEWDSNSPPDEFGRLRPLIPQIIISDTVTGASMVFDRLPDGTYRKNDDSPDAIEFSQILQVPDIPQNKDVSIPLISVPLRFNFDPHGKITISPNYIPNQNAHNNKFDKSMSHAIGLIGSIFKEFSNAVVDGFNNA